MKSAGTIGFCLAATAALAAATVRLPAAEPSGKSNPTQAPRVFLLDAAVLQDNLQRVRAGEKIFTAALAQLEREGQQELSAGPFSVLDKDYTPPSGDRHDYMSQAPYFWPD